MTTRRRIGGYEYINELENLERIGEQLTNGLMELGKSAPTVETSRTFIQLIGISSQISVKALRLKGYQSHEPTSTIP